MATQITHNELRTFLQQGDFTALFIDRLGWDNPDSTAPIELAIRAGAAADDASQSERFIFTPVAEKRSVRVFSCQTPEALLTKEQRRKLERELDKRAHEHLVIFHTADLSHQIWQVPQRETGKPIRIREFEFVAGQAANTLLDFVNRLHFSLRDETNLTLLDVMTRLESGVAAEKVTKKFYDEFSTQRKAFDGLIKGITDENDRGWYAAIMLNRLMFSWFLQSKGFLNNDPDYLKTRLLEAKQGRLPVGNFHSFYQTFLRALFHDGLNAPLSERSTETRKMLGNIPYINGGIFERHKLETQHPDIQIPDKAFEDIFDLFGKYTWHLDDRPIAGENEINPDVLGHIFEKFVNQKEKGAYYTKEDVTGYISQNTIVPWLLDQAKKNCRIAFDHTVPGNVWELLIENPDRYIYGSMKHGVLDIDGEVLPLAGDIAAGADDISQRGNWNQRASAPYNLPTETWREYFHRRKRTIELREKLAAGEIRAIDDLITYNLDIRQFAQDIVERSGGVELVKAMWQAVGSITILDPTVGSGAFLFAAVRVLEPIATGLLERMDDLVEASSGHHPNSSLAEFERTLRERDAHPNQNYYVMRQIILHNLYGVDIEEEAVEICKLRLFLLLAAQLERDEKIEPLPDIDFNIRPGNTLVGYASKEEVAKATSSGQMALDFDGGVNRIEEQAELADKAFQHFKQVQMQDATAIDDLRDAKQAYREKINALRGELDRYLYKQQGAKDTLESWKARTQPFHWFAEFHHVVIGHGGFKVVIGNPPYVSTRDARNRYVLQGFVTDSAPNIYAMVMERSTSILAVQGGIGLIVPLSLSFSGGFSDTRVSISETGSSWYSSYDILPAPLFTGAAQRCTIYVGTKDRNRALHTTRMHRWRSSNRSSLFHLIDYTETHVNPKVTDDIPRHYGTTSRFLLEKIEATQSLRMKRYEPNLRHSSSKLQYAKAALNFVSVFLENPPLLNSKTLESRISNRVGTLRTSDIEASQAALASTVGEFYLWYWLTRGDGFDVTGWVLSDYLVMLNSLPDEHYRLVSALGRLSNER